MERRNFLKKAFMLGAGTLFMDRVAKAETMISAMSAPDNNNTKSQKQMKIVVLTGSPRKNGNSAHLADQFIKGAQENGHSVFRFDCAFQKFEGCIGCNRCGMNGDCIFNDDFNLVKDHIVDADMVVFATPMYYFGVSAQLKKAIDRFYSINGKIKGANKKTAYLMTYANTNPQQAEAMKSHYTTMSEYLGWKDMGQVIAPGVWSAGDIKSTSYGKKAYDLGKSL